MGKITQKPMEAEHWMALQQATLQHAKAAGIRHPEEFDPYAVQVSGEVGDQLRAAQEYGRQHHNMKIAATYETVPFRFTGAQQKTFAELQKGFIREFFARIRR